MSGGWVLGLFGKPLPATGAPTAQPDLRHLSPGRYRLQVRRTGYRANDAHTACLEMGSPKEPSAQQLRQPQALTADKPELDRVVRVGRDGRLQRNLPMRSNDIVLATLEPAAK
jgi:xylan 1,4-beta-xylosidase